MSSGHKGYQKTLIDAVFHEQEKKVLEAFRQRMAKMDRRAQLAQASGIHDEAVLDRLVELDITPETLAAMTIVPLVFVAWADGQVQVQEREVIVAAAKAAGIQPKDGRYPLLEHWMAKRPGPDMLDAWQQYIKALCQRLTPPEVDKLKHDLLDLAEKVAHAVGGFLGFGNKISSAEQTMLKKLDQAFA